MKTPGDDEVCAFCRSRIFDHAPICVRDCAAGCGEAVGYFCNYSCLLSYVNERELYRGEACCWTPG